MQAKYFPSSFFGPCNTDQAAPKHKISITPQIHSKLVHTKRYHFWLSLKAQKSMYHKWQFLIRTWLSESQKIW